MTATNAVEFTHPLNPFNSPSLWDSQASQQPPPPPLSTIFLTPSDDSSSSSQRLLVVELFKSGFCMDFAHRISHQLSSIFNTQNTSTASHLPINFNLCFLGKFAFQDIDVSSLTDSLLYLNLSQLQVLSLSLEQIGTQQDWPMLVPFLLSSLTFTELKINVKKFSHFSFNNFFMNCPRGNLIRITKSVTITFQDINFDFPSNLLQLFDIQTENLTIIIPSSTTHRKVSKTEFKILQTLISQISFSTNEQLNIEVLPSLNIPRLFLDQYRKSIYTSKFFRNIGLSISENSIKSLRLTLNTSDSQPVSAFLELFKKQQVNLDRLILDVVVGKAFNEDLEEVSQNISEHKINRLILNIVPLLELTNHSFNLLFSSEFSLNLSRLLSFLMKLHINQTDLIISKKFSSDSLGGLAESLLKAVSENSKIKSLHLDLGRLYFQQSPDFEESIKIFSKAETLITLSLTSHGQSAGLFSALLDRLPSNLETLALISHNQLKDVSPAVLVLKIPLSLKFISLSFNQQMNQSAKRRIFAHPGVLQYTNPAEKQKTFFHQFFEEALQQFHYFAGKKKFNVILSMHKIGLETIEFLC